MKTAVFTLFLGLTMILHAHSQSLQVLKDKNGFQEYKFGSNIKSYDGLENLTDKRDREVNAGTYRWHNEMPGNKRIGDVELRLTLLETYNNKIYKIQIWFEGYENDSKIKNVLNEAYGTMDETMWKKDNIECSYFFSRNDPDGIITFTDTNLEDQARAYEKGVRANSAANKL